MGRKKRKRSAEHLMERRRKAERKAGIVRSATSAAAPFSTKLAREGKPHGTRTQPRREAPRRFYSIPEEGLPTMSQLWEAFEGLPLDPATGLPIGWASMSWALALRMQKRHGGDIRLGSVIVRRQV